MDSLPASYLSFARHFRTPATEGPKMMAELCLGDNHGLTDGPGLLEDRCISSAALARAALARSRIYDLRRLVVVQDGDAVVLRGRVSSFYHKQLAQEVVRNATDGAPVINAIRVVYQPEWRGAELDCVG
jgi:hypothetical protein